MKEMPGGGRRARARAAAGATVTDAPRQEQHELAEKQQGAEGDERRDAGGRQLAQAGRLAQLRQHLHRLALLLPRQLRPQRRAARAHHAENRGHGEVRPAATAAATRRGAGAAAAGGRRSAAACDCPSGGLQPVAETARQRRLAAGVHAEQAHHAAALQLQARLADRGLAVAGVRERDVRSGQQRSLRLGCGSVGACRAAGGGGGGSRWAGDW